MSDKIKEIRERYAGYSLNSGNAGKANEDRGWLLAEVERLREALKPFAALSLWPDDIGDEWTVNDIRSGYDWDEEENEVKTDDVFIKRGHIRAARKALEGKP